MSKTQVSVVMDGTHSFILSKVFTYFTYFVEVTKYLCEKTFTDTLVWVPSKKYYQISATVPNISKEFGQQIIEPWLLKWSDEHRGGNKPKAPYLKYNKNSGVTTVVIPLTLFEGNCLMSDAKIEQYLEKNIRWAK